MNTVLFQARANRLIEDVFKAFQLDKRGTMDELRLEKHLQEILQVLNESTDINRLTIRLEKFYQNASFLIGLGDVQLSEATKRAWRAYDQFHYDQVKPKLLLHGNTRLGWLFYLEIVTKVTTLGNRRVVFFML